MRTKIKEENAKRNLKKKEAKDKKIKEGGDDYEESTQGEESLAGGTSEEEDAKPIDFYELEIEAKAEEDIQKLSTSKRTVGKTIINQKGSEKQSPAKSTLSRQATD